MGQKQVKGAYDSASGDIQGGGLIDVGQQQPEGKWYKDESVLLVILVVLGSSLTLPYFRVFNDMFPTTHPAIVALLNGLIVTIAFYGPMRYADKKYALSDAVLLGLLVAEFTVYGAPFDMPAPVAISFFMFMYMYGREEAPHLWPEKAPIA